MAVTQPWQRHPEPPDQPTTGLEGDLRAGLRRCGRCGSSDLAVLNDADPYLDPDRDHVVCNRCGTAVAAVDSPPAVVDPFAGGAQQPSRRGASA